ncbi:response regulator transcription factor [Paenibacillus gansuensis]|uniref:Response regulator n=1 Tax=Paenibacillus gansuensis TaxID=306542 RepID=A0ABW5PHC6_9BACL
MYQVMIVDDEASVVDALALRIPWNDLSVSAVFKAYSAYEALDIFQTESIDLVLTDIRMPGMNGLELLRKIKELKSRTKCVLLTGFAEFEYAKQALQSDASDYLLKPVSNEDLIASVRKLIDQLSAEWEEVASFQRAAYTLKENLPLLKANLLSELLQGSKAGGREALEGRLSLLEIPLAPGHSYCMLLIRMEDEFLAYDKSSIHLLEYAVLNIAEEILGESFELWFCKDSHEYLTFLLKEKGGGSPEREPASVRQLLEGKAAELQSSVKQYLKGTVTVLLSDWSAFPDSVAEVYDTMILEMRKIARGQYGFVKKVELFSRSLQVQSLQRLYEPPMLIQLLEGGRWEEAEEKLQAIFAELSERWSDSVEHANEVYYSIVSAYNYIAHKSGKQLVDIVGLKELELEGNQRRSVELLSKWALGGLQHIREELELESRTANTAIIKQAQQYMEEKLSEDVSLQAIANHVYLNPGYLSKLYKLETGENISDYLYRIRMDKSAYFLKNTHYKIQEICELLGYQNTSYFIKMFKKHFGVTPQDYRNSL